MLRICQGHYRRAVFPGAPGAIVTGSQHPGRHLPQPARRPRSPVRSLKEMLMKTRTGNFPIGFRGVGGEWQKDLASLLGWAKENGLEAIDLGKDGYSSIKTVAEAGIRVGSVDLAEWQGMITADRARRIESIAQNMEYVR